MNLSSKTMNLSQSAKISWGNAGLFLLILITFLDVILFHDSRASKILFVQFRLIPHILKAFCLFFMAGYVAIAYRRPTDRAVLVFEYALWIFVILIACNLLRFREPYQYACAFRTFCWIFAYFFFRLTLPAISGLQHKIFILTILILLLALRMHAVATGWHDMNYERQAEPVSSNAAFFLQYVILLRLCFFRFSIWSLVTLLVCMILIALTFKLSVICSTGISLVLFILALRRIKQYHLARIITLCATIGVLATFPFVYQRILERVKGTIGKDSSQRQWRYVESCNRWIQADWFGRAAGYGYYDTSFYLQQLYYSKRPTAEQIPLHAHSDFFQILPDLGLVGVLDYFLLHFGLLALLWRLWKHQQVILPAAVVFYSFYLFISLLNGSMAKYDTVYLALPLAVICHPATMVFHTRAAPQTIQTE